MHSRNEFNIHSNDNKTNMNNYITMLTILQDIDFKNIRNTYDVMKEE